MKMVTYKSPKNGDIFVTIRILEWLYICHHQIFITILSMSPSEISSNGYIYVTIISYNHFACNHLFCVYCNSVHIAVHIPFILNMNGWSEKSQYERTVHIASVHIEYERNVNGNMNGAIRSYCRSYTI